MNKKAEYYLSIGARQNKFKYIQVFKNKKSFKKAQQDEENCKHGDTHRISDQIKKMIADKGIMKNPFRTLSSMRRRSDLVKSANVDLLHLPKKRNADSNKTSLCASDNEPSESLRIFQIFKLNC